ncbi:unnamed protein product [Didymodactylos carnosus]|uniref:25S rRNA (uridine-N(3))-methyltransferase BMT5-like domain-containing protein n=1 Tax=Didymodactylos carnosus TaxID=1234261 RepID=A0A8S2DPS3_9BILA|nr:unnamed protein product [Didymodactylos carnosus]CAF3792820.1 unnamed protein product [Didymodactylos carnosus]
MTHAGTLADPFIRSKAYAMEEKHLEELSCCNKISQTEILDTDQIVPNKLSAAHRYIGIHVSPDIKIKFFLYNETVQAEVSGIDNLVSVELPETSNQYNVKSVAAKLQKLLRNFHLYPVHESNLPEKISFKPVSPQYKTWQKQNNELRLPKDSVWICRGDDTISYAYANTVTTWDWTNDTGRRTLPGKIFSTRHNAPIEKIIPLSSVVYSVEFQDSYGSFFDIALEKLIPISTAGEQKIKLLDNGMFVRWHENEMAVLLYDIAEKQCKEMPHKSTGIIDDIRPIPNAKVLIYYKDNKWTLWDTEKNNYTSMKDNDYVLKVSEKLRKKKFLFLDKETLVFETSSEKHLTYLSFYCQPEDGPEVYYDADSAGEQGIDSMILLSDGSIMYATDATTSGIHVVTRDRKCVYTESEKITKDKKIDSLKELSDGSVAVEYCDGSGRSPYIFILKPGIDVTRNIDYQIECIKLELRHNPADLELHSKLAKLYIEKNQSNRELYQLYLSGLEAAVKSTRLYQAPIIATDLTAIHLTRHQEEEKNLLEERIVDLKRRGVNVLFGVDAEQIHRTFKGRRFKRIQWNCPFGEATAREEFKNTIPRFFQSCSKLQLPDDRVHVTLMQKSGDYWKTRQKENPIVLGSAEAGYRLIRKRSFQTYGEQRYPGYIHVKTGTTEKYSSGGEEQEFIFEKTDKEFRRATLQRARKLMDPHKKKYDIKTDNRDEQNLSLEECYFVCSTDEDSSDYYGSDSDEDL